MELDLITAGLLEDTLKAWRQYQPVPPGLLDLVLLGASNSDSLVERGLLLQECLEKMTLEALVRYRENEHVPHSSELPASPSAVLEALKADFSSGNAELEAWSAVYHLYLASGSLDLSLARLAEAAITQKAKDKPRQFRRRVDEGLSRLTAALQKTEFQARERPRDLPLPAPDYSQLFGVELLLTRLLDLLKAQAGPLFLSLEALGGSGKTALARSVAGKLLQSGHFHDILWISARQEELNEAGQIRPLNDPARSTDDIITRLAEKLAPGRLAGLSREDKLERLKPILLNKSYLVVVDNLETLSDTQDLLPALFPLAGPTRFLLTSRQTLQHFSYVHSLPVPELSLSDSYALVENELQRCGRQTDLSAAVMDDIYQVIGGVPLALKLTAMQMIRLPLAGILEGLREARRSAPEAMYTFIYRRTWELLAEAEPARLLLLSLQHVAPEGEDEAWIRENSRLPTPDFELALRLLRDYALLEITGSLDTPLYHLHRLTITFLQTEILRGWGDET